MPFARAAGLALTLILTVALPAAADTARVTVDRALVWSRPSGVSIILTQLNKDEVVEVIRKVGDWYEIVVPNRPSGIAPTGYISASQVVIVSTGPPRIPSTPQGRAQPPPSGTRPAPTARRRRPGFFNVDAGYGRGQQELVRTTPAFEAEYAEAGQFTAGYGKPTGLAIDGMAGQSIEGSIGIGIGLGYQPRREAAVVSASVPHPFYFNQPRTATFTTSLLQAHEVAVHIPIVYMPPAYGRLGRVKVLAYGGPSVFRLSQTLVTELLFDDVYPFETVKITGVDTEEQTAVRWGYHVGGDVSYFFTRTVGVGGGLRYSYADLQFDSDGADGTSTATGRVQALAGLRIRF
jgi:hypothetical protein